MKVVEAVSLETWRDVSTKRTYDGADIDIVLLGLQSIDGQLGSLVGGIKGVRTLKHVKIIALCAEPRKGDAQKARESGIDGYLSRPVTKDTLVSIIATALGDARSDGPITTRHMAHELSCKGLRILLAEDNPVNVKLMQILLKNLGCHFDAVSDGQAACDALDKNEYDAVLMDVHMPIMSGLDATKIIKKEMNHQVPIIALTAAAMQEEKAMCYACGMDDIILKPINVQELKEKLCTWGKLKDGSTAKSDNGVRRTMPNS
jgi:CheY-like chemotaxis protein